MRSVDEWKTVLRAALREAQRARQPHVVTVLRETLGAIDNAEAAELALAPPTQQGAIAGGVAGLGAGEVARKVLGPGDVAQIIERELEERRVAVAQYVGLGREEEAAVLRAQLAALEALR